MDIKVYSSRKWMDCYNCGGNCHRASNCEKPTKRKNASKRNLCGNEHQMPIPPDFFGKGSYANGCYRPTKGQNTDSEDVSYKECDRPTKGQNTDREDLSYKEFHTAIPYNFFGQRTVSNEASHERQVKELQIQIQIQMQMQSQMQSQMKEFKEILHSLLKQSDN